MKKKRFCPNCGSDWVEPDTSNRAEVYFSGGNPNKWKCRNCNYTGLMPEGDPEDNSSEHENEIEFSPDQNVEKLDTGFGIAYAKYILYIVIPALLIYTALKV